MPVNLSKEKEEAISKELETFGYKYIKYWDKDHVDFICKCGDDRSTSMYRIRSGVQCKACNNKKDFVPVDTENEKWVKYYDKWISSIGRVKGENGGEIVLDISENSAKFKSAHFKTKQYLARTMAIVFKIKDYEKLNKPDGSTNLSYDVSFIDKDPKNIVLKNLIVEAREGKLRHTAKPFSTEKSQQFLQITEKDLENIEYKQLTEFPNYKFYKNGIIWNGERAIGGTEHTSGYIRCQLKYKEESKDEKEDNIIYKDFSHHRLICLAFHPIECKTKYDDYKDLQVNHKNGDKQDNSADNLEWCTQSNNQLHAMSLSTTTKGNSVSCYDCKTDEKLNTFKTVADAGRYLYEVKYGEFDRQNATEDDVKEWKKKCQCCESHIRSVAKGKIKELKEFNWKYEDEKKAEENIKKYGKK
jgi:hypothetical protein